MEQTLRSNMLVVAAHYASVTGAKITAVAAVAARDSGFFGRIERNEGSFTARKYDAVMRWFSDNWPTDAEWPADIPRPTGAAEAA